MVPAIRLKAVITHTRADASLIRKSYRVLRLRYWNRAFQLLALIVLSCAWLIYLKLYNKSNITNQLIPLANKIKQICNLSALFY
jgi:hypothetical protein